MRRGRITATITMGITMGIIMDTTVIMDLLLDHRMAGDIITGMVAAGRTAAMVITATDIAMATAEPANAI